MSRSARLCDDAAAVLKYWRPRWSEVDLATIEPLMATVQSLAAAAAPVDGRDARRLLRAVAAWVLWASRHMGTSDPEKLTRLLVEANVSYFVMVVCSDESPGWRHDTRSVLRRVGRAAAPDLWSLPPAAVGRSAVAAAYTPREEAGFRLDAAMAGWTNRGARLFIDAAAAGAGLLGPAIAAASVDDVEEIAGGRLAISVPGKHSRRVPVRGAYTDTLRAAMAATASGRFIASGAASAVYSISQEIRCRAGPFKLRRARATWIRAHLMSGISLPSLYVIAGPISQTTIDGLLKGCAADVDPDAALIEGLKA